MRLLEALYTVRGQCGRYTVSDFPLLPLALGCTQAIFERSLMLMHMISHYKQPNRELYQAQRPIIIG